MGTKYKSVAMLLGCSLVALEGFQFLRSDRIISQEGKRAKICDVLLRAGLEPERAGNVIYVFDRFQERPVILQSVGVIEDRRFPSFGIVYLRSIRSKRVEDLLKQNNVPIIGSSLLPIRLID